MGGAIKMYKSFQIRDRRLKSDRRGTEVFAQFPIITTQGRCIRRDRRYTPERRISSIVVREWEVTDSIFDLLFKKIEK